jgi:hypothetical protein
MQAYLPEKVIERMLLGIQKQLRQRGSARMRMNPAKITTSNSDIPKAKWELRNDRHVHFFVASRFMVVLRTD